MKDLIYHVMQDGADFYIYDSADADNLLFTRTAPFPVRDFDVAMATQARNWFVQLCGKKTQDTMKWIGA
jgi:hypothetical protein